MHGLLTVLVLTVCKPRHCYYQWLVRYDCFKIRSQSACSVCDCTRISFALSASKCSSWCHCVTSSRYANKATGNGKGRICAVSQHCSSTTVHAGCITSDASRIVNRHTCCQCARDTFKCGLIRFLLKIHITWQYCHSQRPQYHDDHNQLDKGKTRLLFIHN